MKVVFYCFGGYVGALIGERNVKWWSVDPAASKFPQGQLIDIDLSKTPGAARTGAIKPQDIEVDDNRFENGLTGVGPRFPAGQMIGSMWTTELYMQRVKLDPKAVETVDGYGYESMMTMYFDGELGDRTFNGFHAEIVGVQGPLTRVAIWNGGTGKTGKPAGEWWLDLAAVSDPNYTQISPKGPKVGALFIDRPTVKTTGVFFVKKPIGWGGHDSFDAE